MKPNRRVKTRVVAEQSSGNDERRVAKLYKNLHTEKVIYTRWVAGAEATISTSAGGVVALATLANAASISTASDFASLAALYTAYRCRAISVQLLPLLPAPVYNGAAIQTQPSAIAVYPWQSNTVPTTFQQALDVSGVKIMSGYQGGFVRTSYQGDPDAHLWTGTGSAIGSNEQFGISCVGTSTTSTASSGVWKVIPQYLVEFRMAG